MSATATEDVETVWEERVKALIPEGTDPVDVHVHIGHDLDGTIGTASELRGLNERFGVRECWAFCLNEVEREPAFRKGNDLVLAEAERCEGQIIPFVRLDLVDAPIEEARRCLARGARGIKLHPFAQQFAFTDQRLAPIFGLAAEYDVPILIHAGRGLPPIADDLERLVSKFPGVRVIMAHGGIADLGNLVRQFAGSAQVYFDTSVWSPVDLVDCLRRVSPEQILHASDYPYGRYLNSVAASVLTARQAGYSDDEIRGVMGGHARQLMLGESKPAPSPPKGGSTVSISTTCARIRHYLAFAASLVWNGHEDNVGWMGLAANVCDDEAGPAETLANLHELITAAASSLSSAHEARSAEARQRHRRDAFWLLNLADVVAATATEEDSR